MRVEQVFSYRNLEHEWVSTLITCIGDVPGQIFFEQDGREITKFDRLLFEKLTAVFKGGVKRKFRPMKPENQFEVDIVLPTEPKTLIEIEKGRQPRLELDIMKIINSIYRFPSRYGYGCIIVPTNYIETKLAQGRSLYEHVADHLIPLNEPVLDFKSEEDGFLLRDFVVIGYVDPRG